MSINNVHLQQENKEHAQNSHRGVKLQCNMTEENQTQTAATTKARTTKIINSTHTTTFHFHLTSRFFSGVTH